MTLTSACGKETAKLLAFSPYNRGIIRDKFNPFIKDNPVPEKQFICMIIY